MRRLICLKTYQTRDDTIYFNLESFLIYCWRSRTTCRSTSKDLALYTDMLISMSYNIVDLVKFELDENNEDDFAICGSCLCHEMLVSRLEARHAKTFMDKTCDLVRGEIEIVGNYSNKKACVHAYI